MHVGRRSSWRQASQRQRRRPRRRSPALRGSRWLLRCARQPFWIRCSRATTAGEATRSGCAKSRGQAFVDAARASAASHSASGAKCGVSGACS
eukprot:618905-Rhodomonas_salina.2